MKKKRSCMRNRLFSIFHNHLLTAFIPWIFFSVFYGTTPSSMFFASAGALLLMVILNFRELKKGFILPWGSVIFFAFLAINDRFVHWKWAESHAFLLINSALAVIVLFSMVIGKPFTIQYAKEEVEPQYWDSPTFLKVNWILTSIWAILMIVMALPSYFLTQEQILKSWFWNYGLTILCILIGLQCNKIVPKFFTDRKD